MTTTESLTFLTPLSVPIDTAKLLRAMGCEHTVPASASEKAGWYAPDDAHERALALISPAPQPTFQAGKILGCEYLGYDPGVRYYSITYIDRDGQTKTETLESLRVRGDGLMVRGMEHDDFYGRVRANGIAFIHAKLRREIEQHGHTYEPKKIG